MKFQLSDLSVDEVNTILAGLMELPAKFSVNLMAKIREQTDQQQNPAPSAMPQSMGPLAN